jgi:2'-hydroxybiphenyl-2-sulfinate desulfinase
MKEFRYTICPVGNASYLSANRDEFLASACKKRGVTPVLLQSLASDRWHVHYTYQDPALFREGGNIPPLWAQSRGEEIVLLGITFLPTRRYVLARVDSNIDGIEDLRGRRLAVPVHPNAHIDFYKYAVIRGFLTALSARGMGRGDVDFVEIEDDPCRWIVDLDVLDKNMADAVFVRFTKAQRMLASGRYKILYEVTANPDYVWPLNNEYPNILTVSRKLAIDAPEIVVEYVKQAIKAARWAKTHMAEVVELFAKQLRGTPGEVITSLPHDFHKNLEPNLSKKGLSALESQKRFLLEEGVISNDFEIESWKDETFLTAALSEIEREDANI